MGVYRVQILIPLEVWGMEGEKKEKKRGGREGGREGGKREGEKRERARECTFWALVICTHFCFTKMKQDSVWPAQSSPGRHTPRPLGQLEGTPSPEVRTPPPTYMPMCARGS